MDCFEAAIEACRLAVGFMTPVILLSDGYMANASEPWLTPSMSDYEPFPVVFATDPDGFTPANRDRETLARVWARPGTPGLEHRIGGIERSFETGDISYAPDNHQKMTEVRRKKIEGIANHIPAQEVATGEPQGRLAVVGWGSTYGAIHQAVRRCRQEKLDVSHIHVRYLNPLPGNLGQLLAGFEQVLAPELNTGQFADVLRSRYLIDVQTLNKVSGQPFRIREVEQAIKSILEDGS